MLVEHWITPHRRAIVAESENRRIYSIDVYLRLAEKPESCVEGPATGKAELCYVVAGGCEAVISTTPGYVELISLRFYTDPASDPASGDPLEALRLCAARISGLLGVSGEEVLRSPEWRKG